MRALSRTSATREAASPTLEEQSRRGADLELRARERALMVATALLVAGTICTLAAVVLAFFMGAGIMVIDPKLVGATVGAGGGALTAGAVLLRMAIEVPCGRRCSGDA